MSSAPSSPRDGRTDGRREPEPEPEPEPAARIDGAAAAAAAAGGAAPPTFSLRRREIIRSASEACLSALSGGQAPAVEERECCICMCDHPIHAAGVEHGGISCAAGHFVCVGCLAAYVASEMEPARLAKNSGRVGCAACYQEIGPIDPDADQVDAAPSTHAAFSEKQLRDTLQSDDEMAPYHRGQQRLVERLLLEDSLVCPSCGYFELVDRPAAAEEYRIRGRVWVCAGCEVRSCHRCIPPMVVEADDGGEHTCRRPGLSGGTGPQGDTDRQLYHRLAEVLTLGHVGFCPRGCPTPLIKDSGCNCMQCVQPGCGIYFCYLCNADLGDDSREAHRSHFRAESCWMFDGGEKTLELAHARRTHALLHSLLSGLPEDTREAMLASPSCGAELKSVGYKYGGTQEDGTGAEITAASVINIEKLAAAQAARLERGGIAEPVVPLPRRPRRHRNLNHQDLRRISTQTVLAFLHHNVILLLMAGHLWATRGVLRSLLTEAVFGRSTLLHRVVGALGVTRKSRAWMWLLEGERASFLPVT